jgi:hypothetical protein
MYVCMYASVCVCVCVCVYVYIYIYIYLFISSVIFPLKRFRNT